MGEMATGKCRYCGYTPVAFEAQTCPKCGGKYPNPGVVSRFAGLSTWLGILIGGGAGAVLGSFFGGVGYAIAYCLLGILLGCFLGLAGGLAAGLAARLFGKR